MKITQNNVHGNNHANVNGENVELFQTKSSKTNNELREEFDTKFPHIFGQVIQHKYRDGGFETRNELFIWFLEKLHQREQALKAELLEKVESKSWDERGKNDDEDRLVTLKDFKTIINNIFN